ncbi:MAG: hypothetical protein GX616_06930 [Planctomycetes bacterium]|nr:hypothetical protein [Planctomycetota bacterium]
MTARTPKTSEIEVQRYITTGEHDPLHAAWAGRNLLAQAQAGDHGLRATLIEEVRRLTAGRECPSLPPGFDTGQFVLGKVGPMVRGLFPAKEQPVLLDLFAQSLVFVTREDIEKLLGEIQYLFTAWQIANLYLGSLHLPGLDGQPVELVGLSEATTFYVSMAYFRDGDPFADWVVHEAAHVFHNWKRSRAGLPHAGTREWLLDVAFAKREVFAYACEAYARILERAPSPAERRRLHAGYAQKWGPVAEGLDRAELVDVLAEAVRARNGWKRILGRCSPESSAASKPSAERV